MSWSTQRWVAGITALLVAIAPTAFASIETADAVFAKRAEGHDGGRASEGPIGRAIAAYEAALEAEPDRLDVAWKLARAYHFRAQYATPEPMARKAVLAAGRDHVEAVFDRLAARLGGREALDALKPGEINDRLGSPTAREDVARLYFYGAMLWALWGELNGVMASIRAGVANTLHTYANRAIALDPTTDVGGPHRLLSRLHAVVPRVPFMTGWVDRSEALPELERARKIAPDHLGNRFLLGITLLDLQPERSAEARALLEQVRAATPRASMLVEDLETQESAARRLAELEP